MALVPEVIEDLDYRLNPFVNQVHFYLRHQPFRREERLGLNPFVNQVHFYKVKYIDFLCKTCGS